PTNNSGTVNEIGSLIRESSPSSQLRKRNLNEDIPSTPTKKITENEHRFHYFDSLIKRFFCEDSKNYEVKLDKRVNSSLKRPDFSCRINDICANSGLFKNKSTTGTAIKHQNIPVPAYLETIDPKDYFERLKHNKCPSSFPSEKIRPPAPPTLNNKYTKQKFFLESEIFTTTTTRQFKLIETTSITSSKFFDSENKSKIEIQPR
ncbi:8582_t:CDS:2, partial [Scutellospora calospora]